MDASRASSAIVPIYVRDVDGSTEAVGQAPAQTGSGYLTQEKVGLRPVHRLAAIAQQAASITVQVTNE